MTPKARSKNLIVQEVDDEVLVYDTERDKAHRLNAAAAAIWRRCDGRREVRDLAADMPEDVVVLALQQLQKASLLEGELPQGAARMSRRAIARTIGIAAIALPVITTIVAPTPAQAASNIPHNSPCATQSGGVCINSLGTCAPPFNCQTQGAGATQCTCK